ncbi:hypothetical protein [uncultured Arsenicicoccus sp.]|uniref:hypothetical protein n=1 Tax=uncultured Arsenicicoccus sp. TaxID=491339 RepID=UPI002592D4B8|nr:hypothetical protein [uncultured Arsenicicoccus sp.]
MTRQTPPLARRRLSDKSRLIVLDGVVWTFIGVGVIAGTSPTDGAPHLAIPDPIRCLWWLVPGIVAIAAGLAQRHKDVAVALLMIGPAIRLTSYLYAWIISLIPGAPDGVPNGWYYAAINLIIVVHVVAVARIGRTEKRHREAITEALNEAREGER